MWFTVFDEVCFVVFVRLNMCVIMLACFILSVFHCMCVCARARTRERACVRVGARACAVLVCAIVESCSIVLAHKVVIKNVKRFTS